VVNDGGANLDFRVEGDTNANLLVVDAGNERVGIGTSSPDALLNVDGIASFGAGSASTPSIARAGDLNTGFFFVPTDVIGITTGGTERARITAQGYFKASDNGSYVDGSGEFHEFVSTADNTVLGLRDDNASYASQILFLRAARDTTNNSFNVIRYFNGGASVNRFLVADSGNVTNTNNSYGAISDVKLKQDIVDAGSQWDDIKNLRVRKYRWKSDPDGFMQMGLVAQEAELVSPGLIDEHPDDEEIEVTDGEGNVTTKRQATGTTTKAIKYSVLYMKAVKALQEAIERIETLEASNTALEARIAALEAQ
jgi:hypothetical protein